MLSAARITKPPKKVAIPPLQNGDHLTIKEFRKRYEAMPVNIKAELINGVVYMSSPVTMSFHGQPHANLSCWLGTYRAYTPGLQAGDNATLRELLGEHEPQPDLCLRILEAFGGQSATNADGYVVGAPEYIGEISASSVSYDLHEKLQVYQENGVLEYAIWRVLDEEIDWLYLKRGKFQRLAQTNGIYKSRAFPGLWLDTKAMIADDLATVLEVVQQGIASPEHRRFVEKLRSRKK